LFKGLKVKKHQENHKIFLKDSLNNKQI